MNIKIALLVLAIALWSSAQDIWKYANGGADAIVFINSEQGEKNMTPELWEKIQKEKKASAALEAQQGAEEEEDDDESMSFDFKDRHILLLLNIFVESKTPMVVKLEGAISLKGNAATTPLEDLKGLMKDQSENPDVKQQKIKVDGKDAYRLNMAMTEKGVPMDCLIIPQDDNTFEFKCKLNASEGIMNSPVSRANGTSALTDGLSSGNNALAVACNTQMLAGLMNGEMSPQVMALKTCLEQTDNGKILCRVDGGNALLTITLHFFNPEAAQEKYTALKPFLDILMSQTMASHYAKSLTSSVTGNLLIINATLDIEKSWALISKIRR